MPDRETPKGSKLDPSDPRMPARLKDYLRDHADTLERLRDGGGECEFCPDGHRRPGSKPMAVEIGPERDSDGQPDTLHVGYAAGHHVSEAEAEWLRSLIREASSPPQSGS